MTTSHAGHPLRTQRRCSAAPRTTVRPSAVAKDIALRTASPGPAHVPAVELKRWLSATAATLVLLGSLAAPDALAAKTKQPPSSNDPNRCSLETLDKFADTRRAFSQEASSGMDEAYVDVRGCDFSNLDLTKKVFSGVLMRNANLSGSNFVGCEFARADALSADLSNTDFTDANVYSSKFDGANLSGAQFENSILTGTTFGKDPYTKEWANLAGAHFEGALLATSDIVRMCENPTIDTAVRKYELGCRPAKP